MTRILLLLLACLLMGCCPTCPPQVVQVQGVEYCPPPAMPVHIPLPTEPMWDPETANAVLHNSMADRAYQDEAQGCFEHYRRQLNATRGVGGGLQ